eukprot:4006163-Karenia_brevis.AAC.1
MAAEAAAVEERGGSALTSEICVDSDFAAVADRNRARISDSSASSHAASICLNIERHVLKSPSLRLRVDGTDTTLRKQQCAP